MDHQPPWELFTPEALSELLCGNDDAARCVRDIARCSHTYDDLIDRDKPVADAVIHDLIWTLMIALPVNPFYRAHQDVIRPVLITGILNWQAATDIERSGCEEELRLSHVLRYAVADVLLICMEITGGHEHAMRHARRARLMSQADTWAHYRSEHHPMEDPHVQTQTN